MTYGRQVTEADFRAPEYRNAKPEDYEFRKDGRLVRKDRWETGIHRIVDALGWYREAYEIDEVVREVQRLVEEAGPTAMPRREPAP